MIDRDSGSITTHEIIRLFIELGWHVSFVPRDFAQVAPYTAALHKMGVEVLIEPFITNLEDILQTRPPNFYDVIFAFRVETLWDWYERLRVGYPAARIIFHDIDLHYLRLQRRADLLFDSALQIEAEIVQDRELQLFVKADCSVVVTDAEKEIIKSQLPLAKIVVFPYTINTRLSQVNFDARRHICFIGGYSHDPNVDAVVYFVREIWPLAKSKLPSGAKFLVIGPDAPAALSSLVSEDVVLTGHLPSLDEVMDSCRLSVAPLRYGAGIKGKLVKSLADGLPAVASSIAVEGMGLTHGKEVLVSDDPADFAAEVVRLYSDPDLWQSIQAAGYNFIKERYSWARGLELCRQILDTANETWIKRRRNARSAWLREFVAGTFSSDYTTPARFDPLQAFSETYYRGRYDDAVERGGKTYNGYTYFLQVGVPERRTPSEPVDRQETVRKDLEEGRAEDAFTHWLTIGQPAGPLSAPPGEAPITELTARTLSRERARAMAVLHARTTLDFTFDGVPELSVILVLHDQFELTMMALGSLRANYPGRIELILIDSGSSDETRDITRYVLGVTHFRFESNIGFLLGCNAALNFATADLVLYLNNDTELAPGAIAQAMRRLKGDSSIGAVGGKILRAHGLLQEAGNIIFCDGSTMGYGRDLSPLAPEVNFVRDVEFCSGVFLMSRRALLNELEGFDDQFAPAYYEDTDLCVRIRAAGYRVVYDPAVVVHHLEYGSAVSNRASEAEIGRARQIFARKHADYIATRPLRVPERLIFNRLADTTRKRVLFIEDTVPLRMIGSGFVRSNDIVRAMAGLGYQVTLYPINGCRFDPAAVHADMPDSVEVMYRSSLEQFPAFMVRRLDYFHAIWVARTHNLAAVRNALARAAGESGARPPIILDTEAVVATREALRAAIEGRDFDLDEALGRELAGAEECRAIVATNKAEAALLRERGFADVSVIGHALPVRRTPRPFAERAGMLFVGAMHLPDSPNYDSLCWFVDEVLPLIGRKLGWRTRLTVVGYTGPGIQLDRFRDHPQITLRGAVTDLEPLYDSHLVFAAPTRIAAGTPYKVHEAASFGLPVVATNLLRRQLGWEDGLDLLSAEVTDPAGFAERLIAVQSDETLWTILREAALQRIHAENNPDEYAAAISAVLDPPRIIFSPQPSPTIGVEANDIACGATESHQVATAMTPNAEKPPPAA